MTKAPEVPAKLSNDPMSLYGIGAEVFRRLGGGEEYLKRDREELQFPAEACPRKAER